MQGKQPTDEERREAEDQYQAYFEQALGEPVKHIKHDANAHDDPALIGLIAEHGMAYYGLYWLLAELLAGKRGHEYTVADEHGWRKLRHDLSAFEDVGDGEVREFVMALASCGLISREDYAERNVVTIPRIKKDARAYADGVAKKRLGAWKTNKYRLGSQNNN